MRNTILLLAAALLFPASAPAQTHLFAVLETESELFVDSVALGFASVETIPTPDFGGNGVVDTFDFGPGTMFPMAVWVWYTVDGAPAGPLFVPEPAPDFWYDLEAFDRGGRIKFVLAHGGVEEGRGPTAPSDLSAVPNPFRTTTEFRIAMPDQAPWSLTVFDRTGRAVRSLARSERFAGPADVRWDGRDDQGQRLEPGVYLARLAAGPRNELLKLVLAD